MLIFFFISILLRLNECSVCGDGICSDDESKSSCPKDCDEDTCSNVYSLVKNGCMSLGWKNYITNVSDIAREYMFKPPHEWVNGTIIVMHGGGGSAANICYPLPKDKFWYLNDILRGVYMVDFGSLALSQGYAIFSMNSAFNRGTTDKGKPIGKRFESLEEVGKENHDLKFISHMINDVIPSMRPPGTKKDVFVTGISNGGFMTTFSSTFSSTTFSTNITAFAPISSGDPYGMYYDMSKPGARECAPGTWRNIEYPNKKIDEKGSCDSGGSYPHELPWPANEKRGVMFFKQFHHEEDLGVDPSCVEKTRSLLVQHGFVDDGAFVLKAGGIRKLEHHFWQREYNQPLLDFFFKVSSQKRSI